MTEPPADDRPEPKVHGVMYELTRASDHSSHRTLSYHASADSAKAAAEAYHENMNDDLGRLPQDELVNDVQLWSATLEWEFAQAYFYAGRTKLPDGDERWIAQYSESCSYQIIEREILA